jgi:carboxypeptidase Q
VQSYHSVLTYLRSMNRNTFILAAALFVVVALGLQAQPDGGAAARALIAQTSADSILAHRVADFVDHYPHRLSGSAMLEQGLDWIVASLRREGWAVREQPVVVPHWQRGTESLSMVSPVSRNMPMLGLGGSVGTEGKPLRAKVFVVGSFEELERKSAQAKGRIVLFNVPFTDYGSTVRYRYDGAVQAAKHGAVASLVRSVGPYGIQTPHTGGMGYDNSVQRIPHAAITMEDAMMLQRFQDRGETVELELSMSARWLPDAPSRNIVIEIPGSEKPNEVVVMGGHIDSWDVGQGAMDDAGGCFAAWRALHAMRALGMKPKRTIRVVFWTNEENGLRGGHAYEEQTRHETHVLAVESDEGTFAPRGFSTNAKGPLFADLTSYAKFLEPIGAGTIEEGGGGADISPLEEKGVPVMSLQVDGSRYFWYHHTDGDTFDKLDAKELNHCAAALAVITWYAAQR